MRAIRGLFLGLTLSFLNLAGAFLTLVALGGLGDWSNAQFIGMFGLLELASGIAFIICPNIWRLPVAEANTSKRTDIQLAATTMLIPHWAASAKALAGLVLLGYAMVSEGVGPAAPLVLVIVALVVAGYLGLSLIFARLGVARPDLDVIQLVLKRPGKEDRELPGLSIGAMFVQMVLNIGAFPAIKVLPASVLFQPELAPSFELLAWTALVSGVVSAIAIAAWWGRIAWQAPREQQREAETAA